MCNHTSVNAQVSAIRGLALSAGLLAIAMLVILAQTGGVHAATGLGLCTGTSKQDVIDCCNKYVARYPQHWMRLSQTNCRQAVVCRSSLLTAPVKICSIRVQKDYDSKKSKGLRISDVRLKANIHRVGTTVLNLPLYTFQYRDQNGTYIGVMAQDVLKVAPSAVFTDTNGYYMVDYGKLGIEMERIQ
jgi:hypothetical protein